MINYSISIMGTKPGTKKADIVETKAYGVVQTKESVDINAFAKHIANHGCVYKKGDIIGLLTLAVSCLRELLLEGKRVRLGDLGDFQARIKSEGAATPDAFTAANIKAINVSWNPGKEFQNLRSAATFKLVPTRKAQSEAIEEIKNEETIHGLE